jgi:DnaJ-class molecular chaperone
MTICPTCKGEGLVWNRTTSFSGKRRGVDFQEFCPQCQGLGTIDDKATPKKASKREPKRKQ